MAEMKTPQDLAYAASDKIDETATRMARESAVMNLALAAMTVGAVAAGAGLLPAVALLTSYTFWVTKRTRDQALTLRDSFNDVSKGLGDEACAFQLDPLKRIFAKVQGFNKQDLNLKTHYEKNRNSVLIYGAISILSPVLAPVLLAKLVNEADIARIKTVKAGVSESQDNLRRKYPLHFDP